MVTIWAPTVDLGVWVRILGVEVSGHRGSRLCKNGVP